MIIATILVIDDDDDVRELIELALDSQGHDVDSAGDGQAAVAQLAQHAYHLVVCDLSMLVQDEEAVRRAINAQPPPRPAMVVITGYVDGGSDEEGLRTAQVPVLHKPFDVDVLREAVRRALGGP